jgi:hypothetical protein
MPFSVSPSVIRIMGRLKECAFEQAEENGIDDGGGKKRKRNNVPGPIENGCITQSDHMYFACCPIFAWHSTPDLLTCVKGPPARRFGRREEVPRRESDLRPEASRRLGARVPVCFAPCQRPPAQATASSLRRCAYRWQRQRRNPHGNGVGRAQ